MKEDVLFSSPDTWLLNLGYVSENSEQNLILYGYLSSRGVVNVELLIDVEQWLIKYAVVLNRRSWCLFRLQRWLDTKTQLRWKLALFCFLKVFGSYNPNARISRCVRDYAGKQWKTQVEVIDVKRYNEAAAASGGTESRFFTFRDVEDKRLRDQEGHTTATT